MNSTEQTLDPLLAPKVGQRCFVSPTASQLDDLICARRRTTTSNAASERGGPDTADEFARRCARLAPLPAPSAPPPSPAGLPSPDAAAGSARAARLNTQYLDELRQWNTLPWWKRRLVAKPTTPAGI